jgi:hypothetical protein
MLGSTPPHIGRVEIVPEFNTSKQGLEPHFVSVKAAAEFLDSTPWSVYQLLDAEVIDSQYEGRRRKVVLSSLRAYAESLPRERPDRPDGAA